MNKLKYILIILVLAACGNDKSADSVKTPQEQAVALRDSALRISAKNADAESRARSIALLDQAMSLDPKNKSIYNAKMNIYSKSEDYDGMIEVLETLKGSDLKDPYSTLHLGMEYELSGKKEKALETYSEAVEGFMTILDTMKVDHRLKRNTIIMNVALASTLSESAEEKERLNEIMSEAERENLREAMDQLNKLSRQELLSTRRKTKP